MKLKKRIRMEPGRAVYLSILPLLTLVLSAGIVLNCATFGKAPSGERLSIIQKSANYGEGQFVNARELPEGPGFFSVAWEWLTNDAITDPVNPLPLVKRTLQEFQTPPRDGMRITWFGHSSLMVEMDGSMILIDPVWGDRVSPVSFLGPERFHENPLPLEDLVKLPIDAVVISHDHYDHLDHPAIVALKDTNAMFLVPLGVGSHLEHWGIESDRIIELDWWGQTKVGSITFTATPAQHFSGRTLEDRDATLWSSWALQGPVHSVFYSGDTGYFDGFKEIGERFRSFDVSIMAIGAYDDRWAPIHLNPEEAVQAHLDVRAEKFIPVHWGTFNLAFHSWTEPVERTLEAARRHNVEIWTPRPGQSLAPPTQVATDEWWSEAVEQIVNRTTRE